MSTPTLRQRQLRIELLDTWHVGTGRGEGQYLDAVVDRDDEGLPWVPGRMLRGLIRDACECLAAWGHAKDTEVVALFGGQVPSSNAPGRSLSSAGCLMLSSARLPVADRTALRAATPKVRQALFMESFQTALDAATGCAKKEQLRGIELVVPLTLFASVEVCTQDDARATASWDLLALALPLVLGVGAHKTRGHGRARVSLVAAGQEQAA